MATAQQAISIKNSSLEAKPFFLTSEIIEKVEKALPGKVKDKATITDLIEIFDAVKKANAPGAETAIGEILENIGGSDKDNCCISIEDRNSEFVWHTKAIISMLQRYRNDNGSFNFEAMGQDDKLQRRIHSAYRLTKFGIQKKKTYFIHIACILIESLSGIFANLYSKTQGIESGQVLLREIIKNCYSELMLEKAY